MQPNSPVPPSDHRSRYGIASCIIFGLTLLIWLISSTVFESAFVGLSPQTERWLGVATLILPAVVGAALGGIGLAQARQNRAWSLVGLVLNTAFALFFALVLSFAG